MRSDMLRRLMLALVVLAFSGCREEAILHGLDESLANRILLVLERAGVEVEKARDGELWKVRVPDEQVHQALQLIQGSRVLRLPEDSEPTSLLQSREEKDFVVARRASQALEQTLERIPQVLEARVHLHQPSTDLLEASASQKPDSASVLLVAQPAAALNIAEVQKLVSGAVGVAPEAVAVMLSTESEVLPTATVSNIPISQAVENIGAVDATKSVAAESAQRLLFILAATVALLGFVLRQILCRPKILRPAIEKKSPLGTNVTPEALFQQAEPGAKVLRPSFELGRQCR